MTMLERLTQVAAKVEADSGVKETLLGADFFLAFNIPTPQPVIEMHPRVPVREDLSPTAPARGRRQGSMHLQVEMIGSGAAGTAPFWGKLLRACGFKETPDAGIKVEYTLSSVLADIPSLTLEAQLAGDTIHRLWGARGRLRFVMEVGRAPYLDIEFIGSDFEFVDGAFTTLDVEYTTLEPPIFQGGTFTIGGHSAIIDRVELDMNPNLLLRESAGAASGFLPPVITERNPIVSFSPDAVKVGTYDFYGNWRAGTTAALVCQFGAAGSIVKIEAPKIAWQQVRLGSRNQIRTFMLTGLCTRDAAGDDEVKVTLT
jgi:hypothetical protein